MKLKQALAEREEKVSALSHAFHRFYLLYRATSEGANYVDHDLNIFPITTECDEATDDRIVIEFERVACGGQPAINDSFAEAA